MCVGAVRPKGQGHSGVEDAELPHHLLHAAYGALLIGVGELHHQAGGGALGGERIAAGLRREGQHT